MEEESVTKVDADKLSDEVTEDLIEEANLHENEAEELGDEIWFDELDVDDPNKTGSLSYLRSQYENIRYLFVDWKTTRATVESVDRTSSDNIRVLVGHERFEEERSFELDPDSDVLANLMAYKKVSNPRDLEGCKLLVIGDPTDSSTSAVLVPHNVSVTGQLRFKLYSLTEEIWVKTNIEDDDGVADSVVSGFCYLFFLSLITAGFGGLIYSSSPLIGVLVIAPFLVTVFLPFIFFIYVVGICVAGVTLKSDFMEL